MDVIDSFIKNKAQYLAFELYSTSNGNVLKTGVSPADTAYYKDGAGAWTTLAIADTISEIGSTGMYEVDLTAAECNHDQVLIKVTAAGAKDKVILINLEAGGAEPTSVPAHTASLREKLDYIFGLAVNKLTETSSTFKMRNAADSATIGTATITSDGTTTTRGQVT